MHSEERKKRKYPSPLFCCHLCFPQVQVLLVHWNCSEITPANGLKATSVQQQADKVMQRVPCNNLTENPYENKDPRETKAQ